jgi:hypothetical protein
MTPRLRRAPSRGRAPQPVVNRGDADAEAGHPGDTASEVRAPVAPRPAATVDVDRRRGRPVAAFGEHEIQAQLRA